MLDTENTVINNSPPKPSPTKWLAVISLILKDKTKRKPLNSLSKDMWQVCGLTGPGTCTFAQLSGGNEADRHPQPLRKPQTTVAEKGPPHLRELTYAL